MTPSSLEILLQEAEKVETWSEYSLWEKHAKEFLASLPDGIRSSFLEKSPEHEETAPMHATRQRDRLLSLLPERLHAPKIVENLSRSRPATRAARTIR